MKKFWDKLLDVFVILWGVLWTGIVTIGSIALFAFVTKWLLSLLGVL